MKSWWKADVLRRAVVRGIQERRPDWEAFVRCAVEDPGYRKRLVNHTDHVLLRITPGYPEGVRRVHAAWAALVLAHAGARLRERAIGALRSCLGDFTLDAALYLRLSLAMADQGPPHREEAVEALRRLIRDATVAPADRIGASRALVALDSRCAPETADALSTIVTDRHGGASDWAAASMVMAAWGGSYTETAGELLGGVATDAGLGLLERAARIHAR